MRNKLRRFVIPMLEHVVQYFSNATLLHVINSDAIIHIDTPGDIANTTYHIIISASDVNKRFQSSMDVTEYETVSNHTDPVCFIGALHQTTDFHTVHSTRTIFRLLPSLLTQKHGSFIFEGCDSMGLTLLKSFICLRSSFASRFRCRCLTRERRSNWCGSCLVLRRNDWRCVQIRNKILDVCKTTQTKIWQSIQCFSSTCVASLISFVEL